MAALLTCEMDNNDKILRYMNDCREMGIDVLPPDINESARDFTVRQGKIRFGLTAVKNVGGAAMESIIGNRTEAGPFSSIYDFCARIDLRKVNKKVIESLVKCGAFDATGARRSQMLAVLDKAMEQAQRMQKDRQRKQASLFNIFASPSGNGNGEVWYPALDEWGDEELLGYEKEALGFFISKHPLNQFKDVIQQLTTADTLTAMNLPKESEVKIAGIAGKMREINNRKGERMCFVTLEDLKGVIEVIVFADLFKSCSDLVKSDQPLLITGRVSREDESDTPKIVAGRIVSLSREAASFIADAHISLSLGEMSAEQLRDLKRAILDHPGQCRTFLHLLAPGQRETVLSLGDAFKVNPTPHFANELRSIFGRALRSFS
jgi:DNA polymerase-3 subunit alpha